MKLGKLDFVPVEDRLDLVAEPTRQAIEEEDLAGVLVAEIDDSLADTAAFCEHYGIGLDVSVNCVVIEAKRADKKWYAACLIQATERIDVNNIVRKHLEARKVSFASMDTATALSNMEYGGITPIGLPSDWQILADSGVVDIKHAVIGSGVRKSKLLAPGALLGALPNTTVMPIKSV